MLNSQEMSRFTIPIMERISRSLTMGLALPVGMFCAQAHSAGNDLLALDLEDLSQIPVLISTATLTETDAGTVPASVTVITHDDIVSSGARNLDELLEIYVPNLAYMYKVQGNQLGIRGIISDRNNKLLLTVNGRNMNISARDGGAASERWFSTLGDIRQVTVVSGPGSAVHGPGAIAGIIALETFDGSSFQGTEVSLMGGVGEEFTLGEVRYGKKLENNLSLFLYYGADKYEGAEDAPHKLAYDLINRGWPGGSNTLIRANEDFPFFTTSDNGSFRDRVRQKFHSQIDGENYTAWMRFSRSGMTIPPNQGIYRVIPPDIIRKSGASNQQWTLFGDYTQVIDETLNINYSASYVVSDVLLDMGFRNGIRSWREDNTTLRVLVDYLPNMQHDLVLGAEYSYDRFGRESALSASSGWKPRDSDPPPVDTTSSLIGDLPPGTRWSSDMLSLFGEYQWQIDEQWTFFAGGRLDKHNMTPWMFSPRLALVHQPDINQSWKFLYGRSVRHGDDADLYQQNSMHRNDGAVEKLDHYEILYSNSPGAGLRFDLSGYFINHDVVAYNPDELRTENLGTLKLYGLEFQLGYMGEAFSLHFSHAYTKLLDFNLTKDITGQNISASPYGYGDDLANWNNQITKLRFDYRFSERLVWSGSLRAFWGMPGAVDMADYNNDHEKLHQLPRYQDSKRAFEESLYLNTSFAYQFSDQTSVHLYFYNLLGLIDEDLNKRNHFLRTSQYRDAEPAMALRLNYRFD